MRRPFVENGRGEAVVVDAETESRCDRLQGSEYYWCYLDGSVRECEW
jgi:hypothetical protein